MSGMGFTKPTAPPATIGEMRREERKKTTDPEQLKIEEWLAGKENNIRGLLATLPDVLWEGATWNPRSIGELLDDRTLKKAYQAACRLVHPDRSQHAPYKNLANDIFVHISAAYKEWEETQKM